MRVLKSAEGRKRGVLRRGAGFVPALLTAAFPFAAAAQTAVQTAAEEAAPKGLMETLAVLGLPQEAAAAPAVATSFAIAAGLAFAGVLAAITGLRAARSARRVALEREASLSTLEARLDAAESILAAEPDAVFIWTPESLRAAPGTFQARPRIVGSTATLVDPSSGDLDFAYLLTRLEPENAGRLN
ncbi:MAG: hypothetical protein ABJ325_00065, partial [Nitratireductor sp.]